MSGPVEAGDVAGTVEPPASAIDAAGSAPVGEGPPRVEVTDGREATVGHLTVRRVLPRRPRRTVGAWCFADQMGPIEVRTEHAVDIGPHPHIGLHTVTWLLAGELLHRDTLGSEQPIRPGQLNLMTAGAGVAHAEEQVGYRGGMHGMQLWVAQPSSTRHGHPAFEHHAELPQAEVGGSRVTVLVGEFGGTASPARRDTELVGLDAVLDTGSVEWPLRADFEHALIVLEGRVEVDGVAVVPGQLGYLGLGRSELGLVAAEPSRVMVLGGVPFPEPVLMWWNYVARTREEIDTAAQDWNAHSDRFGEVASSLTRIESPTPLWAASR